MSLFIASLNSGSNGNCYYVGNEQEAVLVDVGISCREIERRLVRLKLQIKKVKAIFISHEHSDHIKGVEVLARKHKLPVYITGPTLVSGSLKLEETLVRSFKPYEETIIGELVVTAFPKQHDASDPHSFIVSSKNVTIGVFTDIGTPCEHVIRNFKCCNAVFLETNYDAEMLEQGNYPYHLKKRIKSDTGHLSNNQALELFREHKPSFMSHVLLSHLSRDNNSPELARKLFEQQAGETKVIVASRYYETEVYQIQQAGINSAPSPGWNYTAHPRQMSLF
jgi:phosphoribosyl 1,2-cyclic phosphodiesterase